MTLIIKELIIRGAVINSFSEEQDTILSREELMQLLEEMKMEIEQGCLEQILQKLESKYTR